MENTRQPIPLRLRQHLRDAVGRMHPSVSFVSCIGVLLAYLTGVYITGSLHEASRWMGAMLACLVRAIQGPRYTERLVALNLICTVVVLMVCILSYLLEASYLVDVAILYGLLNLLAVAVLSRISVRRHREKRGEEP